MSKKATSLHNIILIISIIAIIFVVAIYYDITQNAAGFSSKTKTTPTNLLDETNTTNETPKLINSNSPTKVGSTTVNAGGITAIGSLNK